MSTEPIKAGDLCEIVQGALDRTGPNVGEEVRVLDLRGEHSVHGRIYGLTITDGQPMSRKLPGQPVCRKCRRGYGSRLDGICSACRGKSAWAAYSDHDIK